MYNMLVLDDLRPERGRTTAELKRTRARVHAVIADNKKLVAQFARLTLTTEVHAEALRNKWANAANGTLLLSELRAACNGRRV